MGDDWFTSAGDEQAPAAQLVSRFFRALAEGRDAEAAALLASPAALAPGALPLLELGPVRALLPAGLAALGPAAAEVFDGALEPCDAVVLADVRVGTELTLGAVVDLARGRIRRLFDPAPLRAAIERL